LGYMTKKQSCHHNEPQAFLCSLLLPCILLLFFSCPGLVLSQTPQGSSLRTAKALAPEPPKRVLLINSYHSGMRFSDEEVRGIRENLPQGTQIFIEYMDAKRIQGEAYTRQLAALFAMKYRQARFDAILSLDDDALQFLLRFKDQLFPQKTPVLFCGVNILKPGMLDNRADFAGVLETMDIEASIDFALGLLPQTKHIAVITDTTTTGAANRAVLEQLDRSGRFSQPFIFLDSAGTGLELPQLLASVKQLPKESIIYHSDFSVDKYGNTINIETLAPLLSQSANCPIFVHNDVYLGLGVLGGKLNSGYDQGAAAANLTKRILNGVPLSALPRVTEIDNRIMIDDQQRRRWNISKKDISRATEPSDENIVYINEPEDFWLGYGKYIFGSLSFMVVEGVLIAWLIRLVMRQNALQREARYAVERFRTLFELAPFACVVNDQEGRYLMVNKAFTQATGIPPEHALGYTSREAGVLMEKEDVRSIKQQLAHQGLVSGKEITLTLPSLQSLFVLQASALVDWAGKTVIVTATADITRIRQAELALRESEERYRQLVQNAAVIILKCSTDSRITFANQYALDFFGYREDELIGKSLTETIVPEFDSSGKDLRPMIEAACQGEESFFENINENTTKNGKRVWIHWQNRAVHDPEGRVSEIFSFGADITKHKQAEQEQEKLRAQLQQSQKLESIGRLAGGVAHDFNNMLGVIIGRTEMMLDALGPEHELVGNLEQVLDAANRSADLTKQLLAFARKQPIAPKVLDLNQTIFPMLAMLRRLIGENIKLIWRPGNELWTVHLDPTQVTQILANLCINARDAIAEQGRIVISTDNITIDDQACNRNAECQPGEYVQISVSDDGCGMDQNTRERAFEPFFTTKDMGQGTGLGLAMVSGIISQNHGFINLYSKPGQGTTFFLHVPRYLGKKMGMEPELSQRISYHGQGMILLVEDEEVLLEMSSTMLKSLGYRVITATSGEEALQRAQQSAETIDLLITDVVMPGMNGRDLAQQLRILCPNVRCLFISGYTADLMTDDQEQFLQKPFTRMALGAKVKEILASSSSP